MTDSTDATPEAGRRDAGPGPARRPARGDRAPRRPGAPGAAAMVMAVIALLLAPAALPAHGEGVLELASPSVAAGGELAVEGSGFETGDSYRLVLVGALGEWEIGEVRPDSAGDFSRSLSVPPDVEEGRYQLTAVAPDDDVVARAELAVLARPAAEDEGEADDAGGSEARTDDMSLDRSRSGAEWAVISLLVGAAGGAGFRLLRR